MISKYSKMILRNMELIVLFVICVGIIDLLQLLMITRRISQATMCYLDAFAITSRFSYTVLIPFSVFLSIVLIKDDFNAMFLLKYKKLRKIWMITVYKLGLLSFYMSLCITVLTGLAGKLFGKSFFNWDSGDSFLQLWVGGTMESISYPIFIIVFFTSIFFTIWIMSLAAFWFYWVFHSYALGYGIVVLFGYLDEHLFGWTKPVLHNRVSADYQIWTQKINYFEQILLPIIILTIIILSGFFLVKRRDFLKRVKEG